MLTLAETISELRQRVEVATVRHCLGCEGELPRESSTRRLYCEKRCYQRAKYWKNPGRKRLSPEAEEHRREWQKQYDAKRRLNPAYRARKKEWENTRERKEKRREYHQRYFEQNRERLIEYQRAWQRHRKAEFVGPPKPPRVKLTREELMERKRIRKRNATKEMRQRWYQNRKEKAAQYHIRNRERINANKRAWYAANSEKNKLAAERKKVRYHLANPVIYVPDIGYVDSKEKRAVIGLRNRYIRRLLKNQGVRNPTPELIEGKRALLRVKRFLKGHEHGRGGGDDRVV